MKLIELHILQSFPVTCLNRDDVGAPKTAVFGGATRARVSSQCWKRAIRLLAEDMKPDVFAGKRGHYIAGPLQKALEAQGVEAKAAPKVAQDIAHFLGKTDSKYKDGHKTSVALYLSPKEIETIAAAIAKELKENGKFSMGKGAIKKMLAEHGPRDIADIAIFGRMVADDHTLMLEGAGMFSHALSTHRVSNEIDFFSALDDLKPEESEGAGHIGTLEFNSACYYRYVGLNWDLLSDEDHLGHFDDAGRKQVIDAFLRASILAVPVARHNSMLGHNPPAHVLGRVRNGQPLSLANAFEKPARSSGGHVGLSVQALEAHHETLNKTYGLDGFEMRLTTADMASLELSDLATSENLDAFIRELLDHA